MTEAERVLIDALLVMIRQPWGGEITVHKKRGAGAKDATCSARIVGSPQEVALASRLTIPAQSSDIVA